MKRTAFCHVRKTGGTTLHRIFQDAAGAEQVSPGHGSEQYSSALRRFESLAIISQHMWFAPGEELSEDRINVTVLRRPVERALSNYFYVRAQDGVFNPDALERRLSLADFVSHESAYARTEMENHQTKLFAPIGLPPTESSPSEDQLLQAAKRALDQFDVVGITDQLAETVDLIAYFTGMPTVPSIPRERATDSRPGLEQISAEIRRKLQEYNRLDEELYAYATQKFRASMRRCFVSLLDSKAVSEAHAGRIEQTDLKAEPQTATGPLDVHREDCSRKKSGRFGTREVEIVEVNVSGNISLGAPEFVAGEYASVRVRCRSKIESDDVTVGIHIHDEDQRLIYGTNTWHMGKKIGVLPGSLFELAFRFQVGMGTGRYHVGVTLHTGNSHLDRCFDWYDGCASFGVVGVTGFHFDGAMNLTPSLAFGCEGAGARLLDVEHSRTGFLSLGRSNREIVRPDGKVCSVAKELRIRDGEVFAVEVEMENGGDVPWEEEGRRCAKLCYRWFDAAGRVLVEEGERNNIGGDLLPGEGRRVWVTVHAPPNYMGPATLRVTLLQEHVAWFDGKGKLYCDIPANVVGGGEKTRS